MIRLVKQILIVDLKNNKLFKTHSRLAQAAIFITLGSVFSFFENMMQKMNYNSRYVRVMLHPTRPQPNRVLLSFNSLVSE